MNTSGSWFQLRKNGLPWKPSEYFPLWYNIVDENLVAATNDMNIVVKYRPGIQAVDEEFFRELNTSVKSVYVRDPRRMVDWDNNGDVKTVMHENFFYRFQRGLCKRIVEIETGDCKLWNGTVEIDMMDYTLDIAPGELPSDLTSEEFFRAMRARNWIPFPIAPLELHDWESFGDQPNFRIAHGKLLFEHIPGFEILDPN